MREVFASFPRLRERRRQLAATLSGGERQMLALGARVDGRPRLLLLDEPSLGLAPLLVREIFRVLVELRSRGLSILLVEQNVRAALQISDHGYVLEMGEVVAEGPASALALDPRVLETYLGSGKVVPGDAALPAQDLARFTGERGLNSLCQDCRGHSALATRRG